ncbi:MAG: thiamine phosphate synthase [Deltaproteobacteria bacterium]|nr:thiamine phosphate synthase [Deltaproteobacteria bacterium]
MTAGAATPRAPRVMLVVTVDDAMARRETIAAALAAGADALQLRDRRAGGGALLVAARALRALTRAHGAALVVNDRADVALAAAADGIHLPAAAFPIAAARRLLGPEPWVGRSTHTPEEAARAAADGADYVVLGPVFATPSKEAYGPPLGLEALATGVGRAACPVIAIGGITSSNAADVRRAGAHGLAVIRAVLDAPDPAAETRALAAAMRGRATSRSP